MYIQSSTTRMLRKGINTAEVGIMSQIDYFSIPDISVKRRHYGVHFGIVEANTESGGKDSKYKVKVRLPWLDSERGGVAVWARIIVPMGGAQRGVYTLPDPGTQVLLMFERGDIHHPIVIGGVWSQDVPPPVNNADGKNNLRVFKSKSGHEMVLDDSQGGERIILKDATGMNMVIIDSANKMVTLFSAFGNIVLMSPAGAVRLHGKSVNITALGKSSTKSKNTQVASNSRLSVKASKELNVKGNTVQLNPGGTISAHTGADSSKTATKTASAQTVDKSGLSTSAGQSLDNSEPTQVAYNDFYSHPAGRTFRREAEMYSDVIEDELKQVAKSPVVREAVKGAAVGAVKGAVEGAGTAGPAGIGPGAVKGAVQGGVKGAIKGKAKELFGSPDGGTSLK